MTQQGKELLLKDLCARLPYGVIMTNKMLTETYYPLDGNEWQEAYYDDDWDDVPYLRPMSSMTEEERHDLLVTIVGNEGIKYFQVLTDGSIDNTDAAIQDLNKFNMHWVNFDKDNVTSYLDWLNAHHFDFRGLIPKGLAIEVTEVNNPYKD